MKRIILLSLITISSLSYGQKLVFTEKGFEPVVFQVDTLKSQTIYKRAMDWVQVTFKNPNEVLKANIKNELIRLEGFQENAFTRNFKENTLKSGTVIKASKCDYTISFTLEINIKDGKYRFTYTPHDILVGNKIVRFTFADIFANIPDMNGYDYEGCATSLETNTNKISESLYNYVLGKKENSNW